MDAAAAIPADGDPAVLAAADLLARVTDGRPAVLDGLQLVLARIHGRDVRFVSDRRRDPIQRAHRAGAFYEAEELEVIRRAVPPGAVFVDIGANVGNHSLFAGMFLAPRCIVPVEPNPVASRLLLANLSLNGLMGMTDLRGIGIGLADAAAEGAAMAPRVTNLGAARMQAAGGAIPVRRGDDLLAGLVPDFIKIDVEGMEIAVLRGLDGTIAAHRPTLFVEVDNANADAFGAWCQAHAYVARGRWRRYRTNENVLIMPEGRAP